VSASPISKHNPPQCGVFSTSRAFTVPNGEGQFDSGDICCIHDAAQEKEAMIRYSFVVIEIQQLTRALEMY
jgi:hypothetical protein